MHNEFPQCMPVLSTMQHMQLPAVLVLASKKQFSVSSACVYPSTTNNPCEQRSEIADNADSLSSKYASDLISPSTSSHGLQCRLDGTSSLPADMIQEHNLTVGYSSLIVPAEVYGRIGAAPL